MEFNIKELIRIIGNKYKLELSDEVLEDFNNANLDDLPLEFLEEVENIVVPLVSESNEGNISVDSKEDFYKLVPKEYFDEVHPTDEDGKTVMSLSELREAVKFFDYEFKPFSSNEKVDSQREKLIASYVHDDYPVMTGQEHSWRILEADYQVIKREEHPADNPLSSFDYYVDLGFYPPPEIMMIIADAFRLYFSASGSISLDEVFFGERHKKTNSLAYKKHKKFKYQFFHFYVNRSKLKGESTQMSLETIM